MPHASSRRLVAAGLGLFAAGLVAGAFPIHVAATGAVINQFSYASPRGDYIGQGETVDLNGSNATVSVGGSTSSLAVSINGSGHTWTLDLAAPTGAALSPGHYAGAQRFASASAPGLALFGDGRGCNNDFGDFTINAIGTGSSGTVNLLDATFSQGCESNTAPLLHGAVRVGVPAVVTLTGPASPLAAGSPAALTAAVPGGSGLVTFYDGGTSLGSATLDSSGSATIGVALAAGAHVLTAQYGSATSGFLLEQVTPSTSTTSYQFTSAPGDYIGQGQSESYTTPGSTFAISGSLGFVTVNVTAPGDNWSINLAAPTGSQLAAGTYSNAVRAEFQTGTAAGLDVGGDGRGCNTVSGSFTVNAIDSNAAGNVDFLDASFTQYCESPSNPPLNGTIRYGVPPEGSTSVSLSAPGSPVVQGTAVTLSASVSGAAATAGGTITFSDGATTVGTAALNPSGAASLTTSSLPVGVHNLTASYPGNASIEPATSAPVTIMVDNPTSTALSAKSQSFKAGQPLMLRAAVTSPGGTPTGTVAFYNGTTLMGTATLSGGAATFTTPAEPKGTYHLTAKYQGGPLFFPSTSPVLTVTAH